MMKRDSKILVVIPARGGSKGIPHKNIKLLNGRPLIYYAIDVARSIANDCDICVSTDDAEIIKCVENYGLKVPFIRPAELATDTAGTYEVLLHAISFYEALGRRYECIILLQTTSPFRTTNHVKDALSLYHPDLDMVVSVKKSSCNPYYGCYEETKDGFLKKVIDKRITRRQDAPITYEYNGAIYVININSLKRCPLVNFTHCVKYVMDDLHSVDLDTAFDWMLAEMIINEKILD